MTDHGGQVAGNEGTKGDGQLDSAEVKAVVAKQHSGPLRIVRIVAGVILVLAGLAMLVLPGQGILTILFGLDLIAPNNPISRWIRKVTPGLKEDEPIPVKWIVIGVIVTIAVIIIAVFWGDDLWATVKGWF